MRNPFRYLNSSPEVIRLAVMMYIRYPLNLPSSMFGLAPPRMASAMDEGARFAGCALDHV
jgi:hypothetical protein